jgi:hypothetical protein
MISKSHLYKYDNTYSKNHFSAISWLVGEQVNFEWNDDEVRFVLDKLAKLDFYSAISLKQQSAVRHINLIPSQN